MLFITCQRLELTCSIINEGCDRAGAGSEVAGAGALEEDWRQGVKLLTPQTNLGQ